MRQQYLEIWKSLHFDIPYMDRDNIRRKDNRKQKLTFTTKLRMEAWLLVLLRGVPLPIYTFFFSSSVNITFLMKY